MLGLATNLAKGGASLLTYVKGNLKLYLDFKSNKSDTLKFPCEGSTSFNGTNQQIELSDAGFPSGNSPFTISCWFNKTASVSYAALVSWGTASNNNANYLNLDNANHVKAGFYSNDLENGSGTDTSAGTWYHATVTYDGTTRRIYVNGSEEVNDTPSSVNVTLGGTLYIGTFFGTYDFNGKIANVGVWSRALSPEEINSVMRKNYSQLKTVEKTSLVSWWALDDVYLGSTTNASDDNQAVYDTAKIMEDKNGSVGSNLVPDGEFESGVDNWTVTSGTISLNSDGNMLITGVGGTANAKLNALTLETNTVYLLEIGIAGGTDTSINVRYDDEEFGETKYGGIYSNASEGTNASPKNVSSTFKSDSSNTGFYLNIGNVGDGSTAIISHVKLYKVTSGNYGSIFGATTTTSVYGGHAPVLSRAVDVAREGEAEQIGDGSALFDGTDDYIQVSNITLPNLEPYTITAWIKTTDVDQTQAIVLWGDQASYERRALIIYNGGGGSDWTLVASTNGDNPQGATNVTEGEWTHASITVTPATKAYKIYMNGILDGSGTFSNSLVAFSNSTLLIGKSYYGEFFEGNIAGVGIWYGELTQAKIQSVMESTSYAKIPADVKSTLGSELWDADASTFDSGTHSWVVYGSNTIANDSGALKITYVDDVRGAYVWFKDASDLSSDLTVGKLYRLTFDAKVNSGSSVDVSANANSVVGATVTETSFTSKSIDFVCSATTSNYLNVLNMGSGEIVWIDNLSLKEVKNEIAGYWGLDEATGNAVLDLTTTEVLGSSFITGDNSDMDTTGSWASGSSDFALSSVSGGNPGNCLKVLNVKGSPASNYGAYLEHSALTSGKLYKLTFDVKNDGVMTENLKFFSATTEMKDEIPTTSSWVTQTIYFIADSTANYLTINVDSAIQNGEYYMLDNVFLQEVTSGNQGVLK